MLLYCRDKEKPQSIYFWDGQRQWEVPLPEKIPEGHTPPIHSSRDGRCLFFCSESMLLVYEPESHQLTSLPEGTIPGIPPTGLGFDGQNRLYYKAGNSIWRWSPGEFHATKLASFRDYVEYHYNPSVSPDGRYLSWTDVGDLFYLQDTRTGETRSPMFRSHDYRWVDPTHVAWSGLDSLSILDTETGISDHLLLGAASMFPRCREEDSGYLISLWEDGPTDNITLLSVSGERLWFLLEQENFRPKFHSYSVWSILPSGEDLTFHCHVPGQHISDSSVYFFMTPDDTLLGMDIGCHLLYVRDSRGHQTFLTPPRSSGDEEEKTHWWPVHQ